MASADTAAAPAAGDAWLRRLLEGVRTIAMVGASPNPVRPSHYVMAYLQAKGFRVLPVNPVAAGRSILGERVYAGLAELPMAVDMVDIFRGAEAVEPIIEEILALPEPPRIVWMQLGVRHEAAAARARAAGLEVVMDRCPKQEWARLNGELGWGGINTGLISSKVRKVRHDR